MIAANGYNDVTRIYSVSGALTPFFNDRPDGG
jgi:hypothetical protein